MTFRVSVSASASSNVSAARDARFRRPRSSGGRITGLALHEMAFRGPLHLNLQVDSGIGEFPLIKSTMT